MSLTKEWLLPMARGLITHGAAGPVYAMGDQVSYVPAAYALRKLNAAGLLRNPHAAIAPCHQNPRMASFQSILGLLGLGTYFDIDVNGRAAIRADFSSPLPQELREQAGVVIDIGTSEHIF